MTRALSIFSLFCAVGMFGTWGTMFILGLVPELKTAPIETGFLLAAEFLTAGALLASGLGLLARRAWGIRLVAIALGMLLYTSIYSIGVFGQAGNQPATAFFVAIALLGFVFAGWLTARSATSGAG
jgi:hypothetical protein